MTAIIDNIKNALQKNIARACGWKKIPIVNSANQKTFRGYFATYLFSSYQAAEFSETYIPNLLELYRNKNVSFSQEIRFAHAGNSLWTMRVTRDPYFEGGFPSVAFVTPTKADINSPEIPLVLEHADVLPGISKGDTITCVVSLVAEEMKVMSSKCFNGLGFNEKVASGTPFTYELGEVDSPRRILITAEVSYLDEIPADDFTESRYLIVINTFFGPLLVTCLKSVISEKNRELLKEGSYITVLGWLIADCATGEYQGGAIFDKKHLYRVIVDGLQRKRIERLVNAIDPSSFYYGTQNAISAGRPYILIQLAKEFYGKNISVRYVTVTQHSKESRFKSMRKALLVTDFLGTPLCFLYLKSIENEKIRELWRIDDIENYHFQITKNYEERREKKERIR